MPVIRPEKGEQQRKGHEDDTPVAAKVKPLLPNEAVVYHHQTRKDWRLNGLVRAYASLTAHIKANLCHNLADLEVFSVPQQHTCSSGAAGGWKTTSGVWQLPQSIPIPLNMDIDLPHYCWYHFYFYGTF